MMLAGLTRMVRRSPRVWWLIASAVLFVLDSAGFSAAGSRGLARLGELGAVVVLAVIAAFSE